MAAAAAADVDDDGELPLAANALIAAAILCGELSELRLPNCDNEFNAFIVAAVVDELLTDPKLLALNALLLLFERGDSFGKLDIWVADDDDNDV